MPAGAAAAIAIIGLSIAFSSPPSPAARQGMGMRTDPKTGLILRLGKQTMDPGAGDYYAYYTRGDTWLLFHLTVKNTGSIPRQFVASDLEAVDKSAGTIAHPQRLTKGSFAPTLTRVIVPAHAIRRGWVAFQASPGDITWVRWSDRGHFRPPAQVGRYLT